MTANLSVRHRRAFTAFLLVLVLFLITVDVLIVRNQRRMLINEEMKHLNINVNLTGLLLREPLLRHDYDHVEQFILQWGEENDEILEIKAVMPNSFLLAHYRSAHPQINIHTVKKQIDYFDRNLITLEVVMDHTDSEKILKRLQLQLIASSLVLTSLFAIVLWTVMKKFAIGPLEKEIDRRRLAEDKLYEARDGLEDEVAKRTEELSTKYNEIEKLNRSFVGRELRMVELKKEIAELKKNK